LNAKRLGVRIHQAREQRGWSQEELAAAVGKDQRAISEYENGRRKLSAIDLPTFAMVLEVPLLYFFEEPSSLKDLDAPLLNYFHDLPTLEDRQAAIDFLRILVSVTRRRMEMLE
jgi:transcriptional regulator with XRE-family HTH domain